MSEFGKVLAFVGGALVGAAAVALLTTPEGEELRKRVERIAKEKYGELNKEELQKLIDKVIAKVKEVLPDADLRAVVDEVAEESQQEEA